MPQNPENIGQPQPNPTPEKAPVPLTSEQESAKDELISLLKSGWIDDARAIKEKFNLPEEVVQSAAKERFISLLNSGRINSAIQIKEKFNLSEEVVQSAAKDGFISNLSNDYIDNALKIKTAFNLSEEDIFSVVAVDAAELFAKITVAVPRLVEQSKKSAEILAALYQYRENSEGLVEGLKDNPFLTDALMTNPRYGAKLLLKFPKFDILAKEKVSLAHKIKQDIISKYPDIDVRGVEFRRLMQTGLSGYSANREILSTSSELGIDNEAWLNYDQEDYFALAAVAAEKRQNLSEVAAAPLTRVKETANKYFLTVK